MRADKLLNLKLKCIIIYILSSLSLSAQHAEIKEDRADFRYGFKVGINFAELWGDDALPESDRKEGYSLGVYGLYKISEKWKFQPEVIWSLQGEETKKNGRYKISYINIPLMFKLKQDKYYFEGGAQLGILTINTSESIPEELKLQDFETLDFSINVGVGYQIYRDWSIGVRYIQGLTNIVEGRDLKNSVIYLGLSYLL